LDFDLQKVVGIEWNAQRIVLERPKIGPRIVLVNEIRTNLLIDSDAILVMQGSFDPPTMSHIELIKSAVKKFEELFSNKRLHLLLLLSLSHVEKSLELTSRTILSSRVEMLELVLSKVEFDVPISIGISNVARYLDLIEALKTLKDFSRIGFILGMDVFRKIFDQKYYVEPLEEVLPKIFSVNYFVAGRENIQTVDQFEKMIREYLDQYKRLEERIHYVSLPEAVRPISSSFIRNDFRKGREIEKYYLPKSVQKYIVKHKLYTDDYSWIKRQTFIYEGVKKVLEEKQPLQKAIEFVQFLFEEEPKNGERILIDWKQHINRSWDQFQLQTT